MVSVTIESKKNLDLTNLEESGFVKIGWFPSARYDDKHKTPVAYVAAIQEYGYSDENEGVIIPARPFIRPAIAHNESKWRDIGKRGLKAVIVNKSTVTQVLENLGITIVGDIQKSISQVYSPILSQRTIDARLERRIPVTHVSDVGPLKKAVKVIQKPRRLTKTQALYITKPLIDTGHMQATVSYEIGESE